MNAEPTSLFSTSATSSKPKDDLSSSAARIVELFLRIQAQRPYAPPARETVQGFLNRSSARPDFPVGTINLECWPSSSAENAVNEYRQEVFRANFEAKLLAALRQSSVEPGVHGPADMIVRDCLAQNSLAAVNWLQELFVNNYSRVNVATDLLLLVGRMPYSTAKPAGVNMAIAGLSHKSDAVKEAAIRAFENWGNVENLEILRNVELAPAWLKSYLHDVISDLESTCV